MMAESFGSSKERERAERSYDKERERRDSDRDSDDNNRAIDLSERDFEDAQRRGAQLGADAKRESDKRESDLAGVSEDPNVWGPEHQTPEKKIVSNRFDKLQAKYIEPAFRKATGLLAKPGVSTAISVGAGLPFGAGIGIAAIGKTLDMAWNRWDKRVAANKTAGMSDIDARIQASRDTYAELSKSIPTSKRDRGDSTPRENLPVTEENNHGEWWVKYGARGGQGWLADGNGRKFWVDKNVLHPNYVGVIQWEDGKKTYPGDPGDPRTTITEVGNA